MLAIEEMGPRARVRAGSRPRRTAGKRSAIGSAVAAVAVLTLAACGGSGQSNSASASGNDPVHVAMVADLTGAGQALGGPGIAGFSAAIGQVNDKGGVDGHKIVLDKFDTQSDANAAQAAFRSALGASPKAIFVSSLSSSLQSGVAVLKSAGVPVLAASSTPDAWQQSWFFSVYAIPEATAKALVGGAAQALGGSLKGKGVAIVSNNAPAAAQVIPLVQKEVTAEGGHNLDVEEHPTGVTSFASQAQKIVSQHPDAVVTIEQPDQVTITKALIDAGVTGPIVGTVGASTDTTFQTINASNYYATRDVLVPQQGDQLYQLAEKNGALQSAKTTNFTWGYALGEVVSKALHKCGVDKCTNASFIKAVHSLDSFTPPDYLAPIDFRDTARSAPTALVLFHWDAAKGSAVKSGNPVKLDPRTY